MSRVDFVALAILVFAIFAGVSMQSGAKVGSLGAAAPAEAWSAGLARGRSPGLEQGAVSSPLQWTVLKPQR